MPTAEAKAKLKINGQEVVNSFDAIKTKIKQTRKEMNGLEVGTKKYAQKEKDLAKLETRLSQISKRQRDITKGSKSVVNGNKQVVSSYAAMSPYGGMLGRFVSLWQMTKAAILSNVKGLGRFKIALMSTGIGAIIIALGSLITYFATTQEGMDKITSITRPLAAIFKRLLGGIQQLGKLGFNRLAEAIKNPREALGDLLEFIKSQVINRFKALGIITRGVAAIFKGDFKEGAKAVAEGALQLGTGVENAAEKIGNALKTTREFIDESVKSGKRLDELTKQIEQSENELIVRRAQLNVQFNKQKEIAQDLAKSEKERKAAALLAIAAQDELLQREQDFLDKKIERMQLEHSLNDTSREDEKELAMLVAQRTQFEATAAKKRASARSLFNTAAREEATDTHKKEVELARATAKAEEEILKLKQLLFEQSGATKLEILQKQFDDEIASFIGTEEQKTEFALLKEQERTLAIAALKAEQKKSEDEKLLDEQQEAFEIDQLRLEEQFANSMLAEEERELAFLALKKQYLDERLALIETTLGKESKAYQAAATERAKTEATTANTEKAIQDKTEESFNDTQDARRKAVDATLDTVINSFGKETVAAKAANAAKKGLAIIDIKNSVQKQIAAANEGGAKFSAAFPPISIPLGQAYTFASTAFALANGAKQISELKKAKRGALIQGPSHEEGGIQLVNSHTGQAFAEMEGGEAILTKGVSSRPDLRALVNYANMSAGGKQIFRDGGQAPDLGSVAPVSENSSTEPTLEEMKAFSMAVDKFGQIVSNFPTEVEAVLVYKKFKDYEETLVKAKGSSF